MAVRQFDAEQVRIGSSVYVLWTVTEEFIVSDETQFLALDGMELDVALNRRMFMSFAAAVSGCAVQWWVANNPDFSDEYLFWTVNPAVGVPDVSTYDSIGEGRYWRFKAKKAVAGADSQLSIAFLMQAY